MKTTRNSINPYVRLINENNTYYLEVMIPVTETSYPPTVTENRPLLPNEIQALINEGYPDNINYTFEIVNEAPYSGTKYVHIKKPLIPVIDPSTGVVQSEAILVKISAPALQEGLLGPEVTGRTIIQFEDALWYTQH